MRTKHQALKGATIVAMAVFTVAVVGSGNASAEHEGADLAGATAAVEQFVGALKADDAKSLGDAVVHGSDMVAFGTDKAERWVGATTG